jgi:hypothetical protein
VPQRCTSEITQGKRSVTADTALRPGRYFGMEAQLWLNLQSRYDLSCAEAALNSRLEEGESRRLGCIEKTRSSSVYPQQYSGRTGGRNPQKGSRAKGVKSLIVTFKPIGICCHDGQTPSHRVFRSALSRYLAW